MYRILTLLIINILIVSNLAQAQRIEWGQGAKANKASGWVYSLGWHEDFYYTIEMEKPGSFSMGGKLRFEKLSKNKTLSFSKSIDVGMNAQMLADFQIVDGVLKIYSVQLVGLKDWMIFCDTYSLEGQKMGRIEVAKIPKQTCANYFSQNSEFSISPNKKLVAWSFLCGNEKENKYEFITYTFDQNGENLKQFNNVFSPVGNLNYAIINQVEIDNTGHTIISYKIFEKKPDMKYRNLIVFDPDGQIKLDKKLDFDDFFLADVELELSKENEVYLTGQIATTEGKSTTYGGFFIAKLNSSTYDIEKFQSFAYTEEFFLGLGYKIKKGGQVKFSGSYSLEIILSQKGGGFLVANHKENYRNTGITDKELVVLPFSSDLTMETPLVIPRSLNSYSPLLNGLGYLGFCKGNNLYLVYTDHVKNISENSLDKMQNADNPKDSKAVIYIATIESGAAVNRKIISQGNKIKGYLIPDKCHSSDDKVIINVGNNSKTLYGEVKF